MAKTSIGTAYVTVEPVMSGTASQTIVKSLAGASVGSAVGGEISGGIELGMGTSLGGVAKKILPALGIAELAKETIDIFSTAIGTYQGFESAMSQVEATLGGKATEEGMEMLEAAAKEMGASTKFTAAEAAEALNYMALAGWDVNQMLDENERGASALSSVLDLAAASGIGLGEASDIVTDYLSAYNQESTEAAHLADVLAYGQANANATTTNFAMSFKNAAAIMGASGQSIETTAAILGVLANSSYKGAEAGTALAAVTRDLTNAMVNADIAEYDLENGFEYLGSMEFGSVSQFIELGNQLIAVADENGNFRDFRDILVDIESVVGDMGNADMSAALGATFTADSIKALDIIMTSGTDSVNDLYRGMVEADGAAAQMSATMQDNLEGDLTKLSSAVDGLYLKIGEDLAPVMREVVQWTTETLIPAVSNVYDWVSNVVGVIGDAIDGIKEFLGIKGGGSTTDDNGFGGSDGGKTDDSWKYNIGADEFLSANGGVFSRPTRTIIGEAGYPEMVLPLRSDTIEMFAQGVASNLGGTGGGVVININGARVNDGEAINRSVGNFLFDLSRLGAM